MSSLWSCSIWKAFPEFGHAKNVTDQQKLHNLNFNNNCVAVFQRTVVTTVQAQDGDRGRPNDIVYSLVSGTGRRMFALDSSTGQIRLFGDLDRDQPG